METGSPEQAGYPLQPRWQALLQQDSLLQYIMWRMNEETLDMHTHAKREYMHANTPQHI